MSSNFIHTLTTVAVISIVTIILRSFAFVAFPQGRKIPHFIEKLGDTLPYGIMGFLIIYCLKDVKPLSFPYGLPEFISVGVVVFLQIWRKSSVLSVLAGTVCYMLLIQFVF